MLSVTQKDLTNCEKLDFAQLDMKRIIRNMKKFDNECRRLKIDLLDIKRQFALLGYDLEFTIKRSET
jgi:hypothetical protein